MIRIHETIEKLQLNMKCLKSCFKCTLFIRQKLVHRFDCSSRVVHILQWKASHNAIR